MITQGKYQIIHDAVHKPNNLLSISRLCGIAGVSRSGYYAWEDAAPTRTVREETDRREFEKVLEAYKFRGYTKGARGIHMRLLHTGTRMNLKKIRRLMKKYGLKCPYRGPNPYRQMAKALKTNAVFPNAVNREFVKGGVRKVLLTDITYIFYAGGVCYLSTILDAFTREILACELSPNLAVNFVLNTVDALIAEHGSTLDDTTIIHSDQGCHYTSKAFIQKLREQNFVQSMSRKGNCWDNAPQESFFGHMKDEIKYEIALMETYDEVKAKIDDWIDYYNSDRYQWELAKLSPKEYYRYVTTGIYPFTV
ncbi:MAG: IS3 family transposase [Clostridia bacterium]|nr:IS3 family transposase [Clostridia bacterium]MBQ3860756.1 IS3 family transposase [Clostridia bacterium]